MANTKTKDWIFYPVLAYPSELLNSGQVYPCHFPNPSLALDFCIIAHSVPYTAVHVPVYISLDFLYPVPIHYSMTGVEFACH